jgi:diguanylate cyclase (GGDEF)-like protein
MVGLTDSLNKASAGLFLPRRFPAAMEAEYSEFSLRVFQPGIRAWHTVALCLALLLLLIGTVLYVTGIPQTVLPLSAAHLDPTKLLLIGISVAARAALCVLAWRSDYLSVYGKWALPLAILGHSSVNAVFGGQIFGPHPQLVAAIAVYAFGASFLTGLQFRHSQWVNGAALCVLVYYAGHQSLPAMQVWPVIGQIAFAMLMAAIVAMTLERSVRALYLENRRVAEMASRDGLTGLKNRRAFDEHLRRVWQLALRDRRALGVMLIDVDFFKSFNDSLGHQAGDAALQRIAEVVGSTSRRPLDLSARYGGEELAVILFDVSREYVAETAARVQRLVEELRIAHPKSSVSPVVTVSTGVAYIRPTTDRSPQGAILLADRGLYAAKRAGRNQSAFLDRDQECVTTGVFDPLNPAFAKVASR